MTLSQVLTKRLDHTDIAYILKQGFPLANTAENFSPIALAEYALFLMLLFAKIFLANEDSIRNKVMCKPINEEFEGKTLELLGLGASGWELATRAKVIGMRIMTFDVAPRSQYVQEACGNLFCGKPTDLPRWLAELDYLFIDLPLTTATRNMIDKVALSAIKTNAVIINMARGEIINEGSHAEAQRGGRIRGAGLHLVPYKPMGPDHPPLQLPYVVATPHVAGVTFGTSFRQAQPVNENVKCVILRLPQSEPSYQGWLIDVRSFQQQHVTSVYE